MVEEKSHAAVARRFRRIVEDLALVDFDDPDLIPHIEALRTRAKVALSDSKFAPGNPAFHEARRLGTKSRVEASIKKNATYVTEIKAIREQGATTLTQVASTLNALGIKPPRSAAWTTSMVCRLERMG
jgi:hypothetical protein